MERAERTLDIAIYDVNLNDDTEAIVLGTLRAAAERGVRVRLLYNLDRRPPGAVGTAAAEDAARRDRGAADRDAAPSPAGPT